MRLALLRHILIMPIKNALIVMLIVLTVLPQNAMNAHQITLPIFKATNVLVNVMEINISKTLLAKIAQLNVQTANHPLTALFVSLLMF